MVRAQHPHSVGEQLLKQGQLLLNPARLTEPLVQTATRGGGVGVVREKLELPAA